MSVRKTASLRIALSVFGLTQFLLLMPGCRSSQAPVKTPGIPSEETLELHLTDEVEALTGTATEVITAAPQPGVTFDPGYTEEYPINETGQIFAILEELRRMEFDGLTAPGWYLRYDSFEEGTSVVPVYYFLVHVTDNLGNCREQMAYYKQEGRILPHLYMDAEGHTGMTQADETHDWLEVGNLPCDLMDLGSLGGGTEYYILSSFLEGYRDKLQKQEETRGTGGDLTLSAWFIHDERIGEAFVVQTTFENITNGFIEDPDTGQSVAIASKISQDFYALSSGCPVRSWNEITLVSGKTVQGEVQYILEYYPVLPPELQAAYDGAVVWMSESQ